ILGLGLADALVRAARNLARARRHVEQLVLEAGASEVGDQDNHGQIVQFEPRAGPVPHHAPKPASRSSCGRAMTWAAISSPTLPAASAPASTAAFTLPTSPRTIVVT